MMYKGLFNNEKAMSYAHLTSNVAQDGGPMVRLCASVGSLD